MLLPALQDLIKPQWRTVLEALKERGELTITELSKLNRVSYMTAKSHCEKLTKAGYLVRTRLPRTEVGRPEILYSLSEKAHTLFVQAGPEFTLGLLQDTERIFGKSTPDKLLFQYFSRLQKVWTEELEGLKEPLIRAAKLAKLRSQAGYGSLYRKAAIKTNDDLDHVPAHLLEIHHPLQAVIEHYPMAIKMELRMIEELLGCRVKRVEVDTGRQAAPHVRYELSS
ncbi:MAG: MarR family transcriptional regulator [Akkermansiaceae bacterium]|nr:MarR family transcriptional regulator [Akkermansiaceae bacterium]